MTHEEALELLPGDKVLVAEKLSKDIVQSLILWLGQVVTVENVTKCGDGVVLVGVEEVPNSFYPEEIYHWSPPIIEDSFDDEVDIKLLFGGDV